MECDLRFKNERLAFLVIRGETPLAGSIRRGGKQRIWKGIRVRYTLYRAVCSDRDSYGEFSAADSGRNGRLLNVGCGLASLIVGQHLTEILGGRLT